MRYVQICDFLVYICTVHKITILQKLVLLVPYIPNFFRIKRKIEDRCDQAVNSKCNYRKEEICTGSAGKSCGLQLRMIDDDAADPSEEECQQKAY